MQHRMTVYCTCEDTSYIYNDMGSATEDNGRVVSLAFCCNLLSNNVESWGMVGKRFFRIMYIKLRGCTGRRGGGVDTNKIYVNTYKKTYFLNFLFILLPWCRYHCPLP